MFPTWAGWKRAKEVWFSLVVVAIMKLLDLELEVKGLLGK